MALSWNYPPWSMGTPKVAKITSRDAKKPQITHQNLDQSIHRKKPMNCRSDHEESEKDSLRRSRTSQQKQNFTNSKTDSSKKGGVFEIETTALRQASIKNWGSILKLFSEIEGNPKCSQNLLTEKPRSRGSHIKHQTVDPPGKQPSIVDRERSTT